MPQQVDAVVVTAPAARRVGVDQEGAAARGGGRPHAVHHLRDPEALTPDERSPGGTSGADLLGHESALSTQETQAATTDSGDVDARR